VPLYPILIGVLHEREVTQLAHLLVLCQVLVQDYVERCSIRVYQAKSSRISRIHCNCLDQLEHGSDTATSRNHSNPVDVVFDELATDLVPQHELGVSSVVHVPTDRRDFHLLIAILHPVEELGENSALLVLKVPQVHLDEQVNVASVRYL